jgi:hypothetical protein
VAEAWMESDGQISVVKKGPEPAAERNGFVQV